MANETNPQSVDGFSDNTTSAEVEVGSPDPGVSPKAQKPLEPEEYERLKEEARQEQPTDGHPERAKESGG